MRIVLGIPMRNEISKGHLHMQIENALCIGYDEIVILDDGSTDGTYEVLKEYESKYNNIHVFRNDQNSVLSKGANRWMILTDYCTKFNPTWINVRSADQIYSCASFKEGKNLLRKRLEMLLDNDVRLVPLPEVHLWRSDWWYRADKEWGSAAKDGGVVHIWRYHPKYEFRTEKYKVAGMHVGHHRPNYLGVDNPKVCGVNSSDLDGGFPWPIVILHYGHSSHEKLAQKFEWMMQAAKASGKRSLGMPSPENMPDPESWGYYNGYKSVFEYEITLKKVEQIWFEELIPNEPKPAIESLYDVISKYNIQKAEKYKIFFDTKIKEKK